MTGVHLVDACLTGVHLNGLKLVGSRPLLAISPIGSRPQTLTAWLAGDGVRIQTGCFFGTREQFRAAVARKHGDGVHAQEYLAALALIDKHAELWLPKVPPDAKADTPDVFDADDDSPL
jgi:hypothetical protein